MTPQKQSPRIILALRQYEICLYHTESVRFHYKYTTKLVSMFETRLDKNRIYLLLVCITQTHTRTYIYIFDSDPQQPIIFNQNYMQEFEMQRQNEDER